MVDSELACSHVRGTAMATTEKGQMQSCLLQQFQPKPITNIEAFLQLALRVQPQASIRQHAIHIQHQQLHLGQ